MQGYNICNNCIKRNCKACSIAQRGPEPVKSIMPRVLDNIEQAYIGKRRAKELVKADN